MSVDGLATSDFATSSEAKKPEPLDIVYPLRAMGSRVQDLELRYSLRGVQTHLRMELGGLFLFGYLPTWVGDAKVIPGRDRSDKALNLLAKYQQMIDADTSDPFLLLDDDHVFLAPHAEIPLHTRGQLEEYRREFRSSSYGRYLANCLSILRAHGLAERNYQLHFPLLIHKATLARVLEIAGHTPTVMASLYGNMLAGATVEVARDFKLNKPKDLPAHHQAPLVSLSDGIVRDRTVQDFLRAALPDPSRWERIPHSLPQPARARPRPVRRPSLASPHPVIAAAPVTEAAAIIRLCYDERVSPEEWRWRSGWFRDEVLPRLLDQRGAECDVWVWVHPRHRAEIEAMNQRVRTFTVDQPRPLIRPRISRNPGYPWRLVHGLPRYRVQLLLGSDDLVSPDFVRVSLEELRLCKRPRAIVHHQPYKYEVATGRIFDCGISVPRTGEYHYRNNMTSMFVAMRQPVGDARYTWVWAAGHTRLWTLVNEVRLVPAGHCLLSVHGYNDSTTITTADTPLPAVELPWLPDRAIPA